MKNSSLTLIVSIIFCLLFVLTNQCGPGKKKPMENEQDLEQAAPPERESVTDEAVVSMGDTGESLSMEETSPYIPVDLSKRTEWPPLDDKEKYIAWMKAHRPCDPDFLEKRWDRGVQILRYHRQTPDKVMHAYLLTPREIFARDYNRDVAYKSNWYLIEDEQTISGPHLVTRMTENLDINPDHKVLEIGTGSGYHSALMAQLSNHVYSIEIKQNLYKVTDGIYASLLEKYPEYRNVIRKNADGYYGWEEYAPFDRIVVTCGIDHIPPQLLKQLTVGGIIVIPVGPMAGQQVILKITKTVDEDGKIHLTREDIYNGKVKEHFVPFTKEDGSWHSRENQ